MGADPLAFGALTAEGRSPALPKAQDASQAGSAERSRLRWQA